jgi:NAD(P)-dependent dehydrogenase (short-subunit alcohol dehydrogenase family)
VLTPAKPWRNRHLGEQLRHSNSLTARKLCHGRLEQANAANLSRVFFVSRAVVQRMIPRKAGNTINVVSVNAEYARYSIAPYSASKGAIKMLTKGMCVDWAKHGIQINGLGPG